MFGIDPRNSSRRANTGLSIVGLLDGAAPPVRFGVGSASSAGHGEVRRKSVVCRAKGTMR